MLILTHAACLRHDPTPGHPESPARLRAVLRSLRDDESGWAEEEAPRADRASLALVHTDEYLDMVERVAPDEGRVSLDPDTSMGPSSLEAALRSAGAAIEAVDRVMGGKTCRAFVATRPPGHHAEPDRAMGFCIYSNAAIAARHAQEAHGAERVAVLDFDVHHGNGTQRAFEQDESLFYGSSHQYPFYPGTGAASETGVGNIVNAPLRAGSGGDVFRAAWRDTIIPALVEHGPDLVILSAGFDAHRADPLAQLRLADEDFDWITNQLVDVAERTSSGRVVSLLEGGYDVEALARCVSRHVAVLAS